MQEPGIPPRWSLTQRIGFRFLFSYFVLFFLTGQEASLIPFSGHLIQKYTELWHSVAVWLGRNVDITRDFPLEGQGSGDTTFRWILLPCYLILAAVATAVWSALDRRRTEYERLHQWFRLLLRFSLALAMIVYGVAKAVPYQMPYPHPFTLVQRLGELTPMRMLWTFMGASPAYQRFTGLAELLGGILLLVPRTVLLGAVVCVADTAMVFVLNLCYDVPVKIMSFHYLLMGLILLAPDLRRVADVVVFNRPVEPAERPPLFARRWLDRGVQALFFLFGLYVIGLNFYQGFQYREKFEPPRPPLYGAWSVEEYAVDGVEVPLATDPGRWRWVTVSRADTLFAELMIGARESYALDLDVKKKRMALAKHQRDAEGKVVKDAKGEPRRVPGWRAQLSFDRPEPDVLVLDGRLEGRHVRAKLRRMALLAAKWHWIFVPEEE